MTSPASVGSLETLAGIYTSKRGDDGSIIAYNRIHDGGQGVSTNSFVVGVYLDNYSSGVTVHNNLVYNVQTGVHCQSESHFQPEQPQHPQQHPVERSARR